MKPSLVPRLIVLTQGSHSLIVKIDKITILHHLTICVHKKDALKREKRICPVVSKCESHIRQIKDSTSTTLLSKIYSCFQSIQKCSPTYFINFNKAQSIRTYNLISHNQHLHIDHSHNQNYSEIPCSRRISNPKSYVWLVR